MIRTSDSIRLTNVGMRNLPRLGFRFTLMVHGGVLSDADVEEPNERMCVPE